MAFHGRSGIGSTVRRSTALVRVLVVTLVVLAQLAAAQSNWVSVFSETFGEDAHPLYVFGGVISFGPKADSPFTARMAGGALELHNDRDSGTSRYYFIEPRHAPQWFSAGGGLTAAAVTVAGEFGDMPGAGLVYRVDPETHSFYAFLLRGAQDYGLFVIDTNGFNAIVEDTSTAIVAGGQNRLTITPEGSVMHLYINDQHVTSVDDARVTGVGVGVIAAGTGTFTFDDFELFLAR